MAIKTQAQIAAEIAANITDALNKQNTAARVRQCLNDINDSMFNQSVPLPPATQTLAQTLTLGALTGQQGLFSDDGFSALVLVNGLSKIVHDNGAGIVSLAQFSSSGVSIDFNNGVDNGTLNLTDLRTRLKHTTLIEFDAPIYNFLQLTPLTVPYLDASSNLVSSAVTPTQLSYLDATSSIQTQINAITGAGYVTATSITTFTNKSGDISQWTNDVGYSTSTGTVTSIDITTANGVSAVGGPITTSGSFTISLGAITPTSVNGNTITAGTGTLNLSTFTLTSTNNGSIEGTNTGDQTNITGNAGTVTNGLYTTDLGVTVQGYNANTTIQGNTFNGISQLIQTTAAGKYPALDGSLITNIASTGWQLTGNAGTVAGTNFIGTTDVIDFVVKTSGAERVRVQATGNVGVGMTASTYKLEVKGSAVNDYIRFTNSSGVAVAYLGSQSSDGRLLLADNATATNAIDIKANGFSFFNGGAVGIGIITEIAKLTVVASGNLTGHFRGSTSAGYASVYIENNRGAYATYGGIIVGGATDAGSMFGINKADRMFILADGANMLSLAIGTVPAIPFIIATSGAERIRVFANGNTSFGTTTDLTSLVGIKGIDALSTSYSFKVQNSASVNLFNISNNGNIGIGTLVFGTGAVGVIAQFNGTAPSTSPANTYQLYSDDIVAGNAAPHFRTELGDIIKLFKGAALTVSDGTLANAVIRIGEIEARLQAVGLLT